VGVAERVVGAAAAVRVIAATTTAAATQSAAAAAALVAAGRNAVVVVDNYLANIYNLSVIIYIYMSTTIKKGSTSTALTRRKKRPTKKQKRAVTRAVNKLKTNYTKTADVVADHLGLPGTNALKENVHSLKLGKISKKWRAGVTHDVYNTTHFLRDSMKALQWPHLVDLNWKCPPKKQSQGKIAQAGGRRRKTRKRQTRRKRKRKRKRRRSRRRKRRRRSAKKKSLTASMKQLKAWIGSTEFNKLKI